MSSGKYGIMPCIQPEKKVTNLSESAKIQLKLFQLNTKVINAAIKNIQIKKTENTEIISIAINIL